MGPEEVQILTASWNQNVLNKDGQKLNFITTVIRTYLFYQIENRSLITRCIIQEKIITFVGSQRRVTVSCLGGGGGHFQITRL